jgi:hypothetical protein
MTGILDLPNELLLEVALAVDVNGIQGLSLACRQLRLVGQEALLRTAVLPVANIWKLASTLQERPDLARAFTHMRLGSCTMAECDRMKAEVEKQCLEATRDGSKWGACCDTLVESYPAVRDYRLDMGKDSTGTVFGVLALIAALASSLKALTLPIDAIDTIDYMRNLLANNGDNLYLTSPEHRQQPRSLLQSRLESLEIQPNAMRPLGVQSVSQRNGAVEVVKAEYISLAGFDRLKRLVVPFERIAYEPKDQGVGPHLDFFPPVWQRSDPDTVLPKTLESITFCISRDFTMQDMAWLDKVPKLLPKMKELEFRFHLNLLSAAWSNASISFNAEHLVNLLRKWQSNVHVLTTFGSNTFAGYRKMGGDVWTAPWRGDLVAAIERCLATSHDTLEQDAELMDALGYQKRSGMGADRTADV